MLKSKSNIWRFDNTPHIYGVDVISSRLNISPQDLLTNEIPCPQSTYSFNLRNVLKIFSSIWCSSWEFDHATCVIEARDMIACRFFNKWSFNSKGKHKYYQFYFFILNFRIVICTPTSTWELSIAILFLDKKKL